MKNRYDQNRNDESDIELIKLNADNRSSSQSVLNEDSNENIIMGNKNNNFCKNFCIIIYIILILIGFIILFVIVSIYNKPQLCHVKVNQQYKNLYYPNASNALYVIDFNTVIMQPHYAYYILQNGNNNCSTENYLPDPYALSNIILEDYNHSQYILYQLVPIINHGCDSYVITNTVPMTHGSKELWDSLELNLRSKYMGNLVYKGCTYSSYINNTDDSKKMYIPDGCYYIVFKENELPLIHKQVTSPVLDYGFYPNNNNPSKLMRYPPWFECEKK